MTSSRVISSASNVLNKKALRNLRVDTGLPFLAIKEALIYNENDENKARSWLLQKAEENNWSKAQKLSFRTTSQGLVGVLGNEKILSVSCLQCETDFVSKNEKFLELLYNITYCLESSNTTRELSNEDVLQLQANGKNVSDLIVAAVGTLGENVKPKKFYHYKLQQNQTHATYVHGKVDNNQDNFSVGSISGTAIFEGLKDLKLGLSIAQHIVGTSEDEFKVELMNQPLLQDESVTIGELCKKYSFKIVDFYRISALDIH